jgi:hypothetical protein
LNMALLTRKPESVIHHSYHFAFNDLDTMNMKNLIPCDKPTIAALAE